MPEENKKKINYKIILPEHLLQEKSSETKEIQEIEISSKKEKPITEEKTFKIETIKQTPEKEKEKKEEAKKEPIILQEFVLKDKEPLAIETELPKQQKPPLKSPERFYDDKKKTEQKTLQKISTPKTDLPPPQINLSRLYYRFIFSLVLLLAGLSLIIFLNPYAKLKEKLKKKITTTPITTSSEKTLTSTTSTATTSTTTLTEIKTTSTVTSTVTSFLSKDKNQNFDKIINLENIETKDIFLATSTFSEFQKSLNKLLQNQEYPGNIFLVRFISQGKPIPVDYLLNSFIKPKNFSPEEIQKFRNNIEDQYAFVLFYTYTRKKPILVFKIKNSMEVINFNQIWEKKSMSDDLKTLFFDDNPTKLMSDFISEEYNGIDYRIAYFENNYYLLWSVYENYLIYSTSKSGFRKVVDNLPKQN